MKALKLRLPVSRKCGRKVLTGLCIPIAWAPREAIEGSFLEGLSREGFMAAINISSLFFRRLG